MDPTSGEIILDGLPASIYNIEDYRKKFSVVSQDIHIFKGSVIENIVPNDEQLIDLDNCSFPRFCTETIEKLESGYETNVGIDGTKLSGGERQKIALMRALDRKTDILVLDEPTSNYDAESETEFNEFLNTNFDYGFIFIITHRGEILDLVDKVIELEEGTIVHTTTKNSPTERKTI